MKKSILLSSCFSLPLVWFVGYLILVGIGCLANQCGAENAFYCGFYCKFSIGLMVAITGAYLAYAVVKQCKPLKNDQCSV